MEKSMGSNIDRQQDANTSSILEQYKSIPWYKKHNVVIAWFVVGLFIFPYGGLIFVPIGLNAIFNDIYFKPKASYGALRKWSIFVKLCAIFIATLSALIMFPGVRQFAAGK